MNAVQSLIQGPRIAATSTLRAVPAAVLMMSHRPVSISCQLLHTTHQYLPFVSRLGVTRCRHRLYYNLPITIEIATANLTTAAVLRRDLRVTVPDAESVTLT